MRWIVFILFAYVAFALDQGMSVFWSQALGGWSATPSLMLILGVFVALWAPPRVTYVAWLVLGILTDLAIPRGANPASGIEAYWIVGPGALGYLLGAYAATETRTLFLRDSVFAVAALTAFSGVFVHLVIVFLITWRGVSFPLQEPVYGWSGTGQVFQRTLELFYTSILAIPVGMLLRRCKDWFAFDEARGPHRPISG